MAAAVAQSAKGFTTNATTCTATLPAPATAGNVLVAFMSANRGSTNIVIPTGFTEETRQAPTGGTNLVVAYMVAAGGEQAISFTASLGNSRMLLTVVELSGVDTSTKVVAEDAYSSGTGTSYSTPALTGTGDLYLAAVALGTGIGYPETWGTGWSNGFTTISAQDAQTASNNIGQSVGAKVSTGAESSTQTWTTSISNAGGLLRFKAVSTGSTGQGSANATWSTSATAAGTNGSGSGGVSGSITHVGTTGGFGADGTGTATHTNPAGTAAGDFLVCQVHNNNGADTITTPTGWTLSIGPIQDPQRTDGAHYVFTRFADGTATDTPTWTSSVATDTVAFEVVALRGVDTTTPVNQTGSAPGQGSPTVGVAMTTTVDGCVVINFVGDMKNSPDGVSPRFTPVDTTGWANDTDLGESPGPTASLTVHDCLRTQTTAGAVREQTWTQTSTTNGYVVTQVAVAPAPPVTGSGSASAAWSATATGSGLRASLGSASATLSATASASGGIAKLGSATAALSAAGSAAGARTPVGSATAGWSVTASASGANPSLVSRWVGAVDTSSATVAVKTTAATSVRIKAATDSALTTGVVWGAAVTPDSNGLAKPTVTGLSADTAYYYGVELDGALDPTVGQFRTFKAGNVSFSFAFGSCTNASDSDAFSRIKARNPALFINLGDIRYLNPATNDVTLFQNMYDGVLAAADEGALYANCPTAYTWSDHDFGGNNSDATATAAPAAQATYRQYVPHYPLAAADGVGIYQTWVIGRVRFIMTDNRSYKSPDSATDDASKTMLGATQKQWFKDTITNAVEPVIIWAQENLWTAPTAAGGDNWSGFDTERQELGTFISSSGKTVIALSGDTHQLAADNGTNGVGGIPELLAAPFDNSTANKGGPWSSGNYIGSGTGRFYGWVDVTDSGSTIAVAFTGYDTSDVAEITQTTTITTAPSGTAVATWSVAATAAGSTQRSGTATAGWSTTAAADGAAPEPPHVLADVVVDDNGVRTAKVADDGLRTAAVSTVEGTAANPVGVLGSGWAIEGPCDAIVSPVVGTAVVHET